MAEYTVDLPPGYGIPTVDLATDLLPEPTMDAITETVIPAVVASPELSATFVARAPAPTGVKATDEANVQPLVTAAQLTNGTVILQAGTYVMDITTTQLERQPRIVGQGEKQTLWNGTLSISGVPGAFSGGYLSDFSFVGTRSAGVAVLRIRGAIAVTWDRIAFNSTADIGILFENDSTHSFTEMSAGQANFNETVTRAIEYRVSAGGNPSFHGCGLTRGSTINQASGDAAAKVLINTGAQPYNAPLSVTFWARNATPLIRHLGAATSTFYGDMKVELLPPNAKAIIVDTTSTADLPFTGSVLRVGKLVQSGKMILADDVVTETGVARPRVGGADVRYRAVGNVLWIGPDGTPEWVPKVRTNRAKNPVAGDSTTYASGYWSAPVASTTDTALGGTKLFTATVNNVAQTQGFIYLQPATDLVAGQIKTISFDVLSPVDMVFFAGGRFGLSGSPGIVEVGEAGGVGDTEYVAANVIRRVRRQVIVPPPNGGGTIDYEGFYIRANTVGDMPANGTVWKFSNITIEDGATAGSRFSGADIGQWTGTAHQSTSVQYPADANVATAEVAYTPTLTNVTLGNGTRAAYYSKVGKRVTGSFYLQLGSTSSVSGTIRFSLPTDAPIVAGSQRRYTGQGWVNDFSATERFVATVLPFGTTSLDVYVTIAGTGGYMKQVAANATSPCTLATSDEILIAFEYETV
jgi:hypothetical protein